MPGEGRAAGRVPPGRVGSGAVRAHRGVPLRTHIAVVLRKIAGMPDYAAHVEHLRRCHPETPIPSERQFYEDFVRARYEDAPTRCC
jgi:uncharacterized short protein YbdD (DUF466 family)